MTTITEIRCPLGPRRLFAKLRQEGKRPTYTEDRTLVEFACVDCRKAYENDTGERPRQVLHRYNILGEYAGSTVIWG